MFGGAATGGDAAAGEDLEVRGVGGSGISQPHNTSYVEKEVYGYGSDLASLALI